MRNVLTPDLFTQIKKELRSDSTIDFFVLWIPTAMIVFKFFIRWSQSQHEGNLTRLSMIELPDTSQDLDVLLIHRWQSL